MKKVKKRKLSYKKIARLFIPLVIVICLFIFRKNIIYFFQSKVTGYPYKTIEVFHELDVYDNVKKHEYSDTINKIVTTEYYNPKFVSNYLDIKYVDDNTFLNDINILLTLGYTTDDINNIYASLQKDSIQILTENDYLKDISNIIKLSYFHEDYLSRYLAYSKGKELSTEDLITYVNIGLDNKYYTNISKLTKLDDNLIIVNKYHSLPSDYVPNDLEAVSDKYNKGINNKLRHEARVAFEEMCEAALKDNIKIYSGSAYRSYNYQLNLYNRYVNQQGFDKAETFSARAGFSEHQTGLATDIMKANWDYISENDNEYTWLVNNSYKYGFNLRYPKNKEQITGYMYEEWHFRYLGKEVATYLHDNNLTYDEYVARN